MRSSKGVGVQRSRFHLAYRLSARTYLGLAARRRGDLRGTLGAAACAALLDVGGWSLLRRHDRLDLAPRLGVDVVDAMAWSVRSDAVPEAAMLAGIPLSLEAGSRLGVKGLVVPAALWSGVALARRRSGRPTPAGAAAGPVFAVAIGIASDWWDRRHEQAAGQQHQREHEARCTAARLAGQGDVAMGADSVVDEISRTEYLLAVATAGAGPAVPDRTLSRWKASLAEATAAHSVYLGQFLAHWARSHEGPEMAGDVVFDLPEGDGTLVLSSGQAERLAQVLESLALSGEVSVRVEPDGAGSAPGRPLVLQVGTYRVPLAADDAWVPPPFDPAPIAALMAGYGGLGLSLARHGAVPLSATLPGALLALPFAWWTTVEVRERGVGAGPRVVLASVGLALGQAVVAGRHLRRPVDDDGIQVIPVLLTLVPTAALLGRYHRTLGASARRGALCAVAVATALSIRVLDLPVRWPDLVAGAADLVAVWSALATMQTSLEARLAELGRALEDDTRHDADEAFAAGQRTVLELVAQAREAALERLEQNRSRLDPELAAEADRRLADAGRFLAELR